MNVSAYKKLHNQPHINESMVSTITTYCLTKMNNFEKTFEMWRIGLCSDGFSIDNNSFKTYKCSSNIEAQQTKDCLIELKEMIEDNQSNEGDTIYLFRE